jgi:hypothetical protein
MTDGQTWVLLGRYSVASSGDRLTLVCSFDFLMKPREVSEGRLRCFLRCRPKTRRPLRDYWVLRSLNGAWKQNACQLSIGSRRC